MPDIRTEAIKVMHSWSKPEKKELSSSSDPLGKQMWEWLKQHPNSTIKQVCEAFPEQKDSSVATGLKSLIDRGILARRTVAIDNYAGMGKREHYIYRAVTPEYKTQNKGYSSTKKNKQPVQHKVAVEKAVRVIETVSGVKPRAFDAKAYVDKLNLYEAREVYGLLRSVFESRL
jgi:predicted transcriptional regulator